MLRTPGIPPCLSREKLTCVGTGHSLEAMTSVEKLASEPSDRLAWQEICERYADSWVCIVDREVSPDGSTVVSGRVVAHSRVRVELLHQTAGWETRYPGLGHYFTGGVVEIRAFPRIVMTDEIRELVRPRR
jgi:hypothetical protein